MRRIILYTFTLCAILFSAGCGKATIVAPQIDASLLPATYTADVVEGSADGITWTNITLPGTREVLTLKSENTYTSGTLTLSTGVTSDVINGTWSVPTNGSNLTFVRGPSTQTFAIQSLTATSMVVLFNWGNINTIQKSSMYQYNRITYTRK